MWSPTQKGEEEHIGKEEEYRQKLEDDRCKEKRKKIFLFEQQHRLEEE